MQALWLVVGFLSMELAGLTAFLLLLNIYGLIVTKLTHQRPDFDPAGPGASISATLAGSFAAACWCFWFIRRRGTDRLYDGSPTGIAWRRASGGAYIMAVLTAALIVMFVMAMNRLVPPDMAKLRRLPDAQLYGAPGWPAFAILVLAILVAPPLEEFVFRGGVFAAIATRFSPLTAGIVTTVVFVAVHAPEKIYYPPGFIDVGLMAAAAAWMRVRFGSIRPGILLHVVYNAGLMVAIGLTG